MFGTRCEEGEVVGAPDDGNADLDAWICAQKRFGRLVSSIVDGGSRVDVPFLRAIQVECPPRLMPATTHSTMVRSSRGNRYEGRKSIKNDTSLAVPAAKT